MRVCKFISAKCLGCECQFDIWSIFMADFINAFRDIESPESLYPCTSCGRKFISDTLVRHEKICSKIKKRKPFNSSKQRISELSEADKAKALNPAKPPTKSKKNNWKQKHEDFINAIRSSRGVSAAAKTGGPLPPPPPARIDPDLVQCPHCSRRFNQHSAERHIQFCKEQKSRIGRSPGSASSAVAQRVAARTKYKPPSLAKRPFSGTNVSSTSKTRQVSRNDERPLSVRHQESSSKMNHQSSMTKQDSGRKKSTGTTSAEPSKMQSKSNLNGQKAYHSNRYKTMDNQEALDSSKYDREESKTKEIRYGRRASKTKEDTTDYMSDLSALQDNTHGYGTDKKSKRNFAVRDAGSPTMFDDYGKHDQPSAVNKKNPFPPKAQVHRTNIRDHDTEDQGRLSKFCYECGTKYPVASAKFCCECGTRRLHIN